MILRVPEAHDSVTFANVRTVFLDRDGVINQKAPEGEYVATWERFHLLPGAAEAIALLNDSGRKVFVVTNQRGISLGLYTAAQVEALHARLLEYLRTFNAHVDGFYYCPHDKDSCRCRKPLPGLFEQAFAAFPNTAPCSSAIIGDSLSDIEAGKHLGMRAIFLEGEPERRKAGTEKASLLADATVSSLAEAVALLPAL